MSEKPGLNEILVITDNNEPISFCPFPGGGGGVYRIGTPFAGGELYYLVIGDSRPVPMNRIRGTAGLCYTDVKGGKHTFYPDTAQWITVQREHMVEELAEA